MVSGDGGENAGRGRREGLQMYMKKLGGDRYTDYLDSGDGFTGVYIR